MERFCAWASQRLSSAFRDGYADGLGRDAMHETVLGRGCNTVFDTVFGPPGCSFEEELLASTLVTDFWRRVLLNSSSDLVEEARDHALSQGNPRTCWRAQRLRHA